MGFNRFTKNVLNISGLPDRVQNQAATLKALFDQAGVDIKEALNALMSELEASTSASNIGADVASVTTKTVQAILTAYEQEIADRYTKLESDTLISENTNSLVQDVDINLTTGVITVTKKDGTVETYDTAIEKVPARFEIVETNGKYALKITNVDGTSTQTDITNLMNLYTFNNSDTINFVVTGEGNEKTVVANIKANSIGLDKLSLTVVSTLEGYMNSARDSANAAKISENNAKSSENVAKASAETAKKGEEAGRVAVQKATEAESYAHGGTGTRQGEDTDNAKYYSQIAKEAAGGDFVTPVEMEAYAQPLGTTPTYETKELSGQELEVDSPLDIESILHLNGNSEQDSRSGKNLFDVSSSTRTVTHNGVTITIADDGLITLNGTATTSFWPDLTWGIQNNVSAKTECKYYFPKTIGIATLSLIKVGGTSSKDTPVTVVFNDDGANSVTVSTASMVKTTNNISGINRSCINISADSVFNNYQFYIQVEEGSTATDYEAYGVQPSPDYPSEIRSVKSKSDNLLPNTATSKTAYGITFTVNEDKTVTVNGTATNKSTIELHTQEMSLSADTYTLSMLENKVNGVLIGTKIGDNYYSADTSKTITLSETTTFYKWYIDIASGTTVNNLVLKPMFNKGSVALPYQPYGYVPVEVKVEGKNKLNLNECILANSGGSGSISHNIINTNKLITTSTGGWTRVVCTLKGLKPNVSYAISSLIDNPNGVYCGLYDIGVSSDAIGRFCSRDKQFTAKILKSADANGDLKFEFYTNWGSDAISSTITYDEIQVEEGTTATPYEPYKGKTISLPLGDIELRSTPDGTRDTFERVDGVWKKRNNIEEEVLNGTKYVAYYNAGTSIKTAYFSQGDSKGANNAKAIGNVLSDKFINKFNADNIWNIADEEAIALQQRIRLRINKTRIEGWNDSLTDDEKANLCKTYLQTNPITVQYVLATPTYTPITDTALISALDKLEQLVLHKGYNRITATAVNGTKAELDLFIPSTASVTEVVETESSQDLIIPVISGEGNVKVKIPSTNKMTLNSDTGEVRVGNKLLTSKSQNVTVETSDWVSDTTYSGYQYKATKTVNGVTDSNNIIVGLIETATSEQEDMAAECGISCKGKGNDRIDLYVRELPSIALPVSVTILG